MTGGDLLLALQDPATRRGVQQALGMPSEPIAESLREITAQIKLLAAAQARTDETVKQLAAAQARTDETVKQLAAAQARTDETVKQLAADIQKLEAAQARTDETVKQLVAAQARTDETVQKLAAAQARTDEAVQRLTEAMHELRREVGALAHNVGFGLEELGGIVLPGVLDRDHGVLVTGAFERAFVRTSAGEEELDLVAAGEKDGKPVRVVVESKSRAYEADVRSFAARAKRVSEALGETVVPVLFGFVIHPTAAALAPELGVIAVASRPGRVL